MLNKRTVEYFISEVSVCSIVRWILIFLPPDLVMTAAGTGKALYRIRLTHMTVSVFTGRTSFYIMNLLPRYFSSNTLTSIGRAK